MPNFHTFQLANTISMQSHVYATLCNICQLLWCLVFGSYSPYFGYSRRGSHDLWILIHRKQQWIAIFMPNVIADTRCRHSHTCHAGWTGRAVGQNWRDVGWHKCWYERSREKSHKPGKMLWIMCLSWTKVGYSSLSSINKPFAGLIWLTIWSWQFIMIYLLEVFIFSYQF